MKKGLVAMVGLGLVGTVAGAISSAMYVKAKNKATDERLQQDLNDTVRDILKDIYPTENELNELGDSEIVKIIVPIYDEKTGEQVNGINAELNGYTIKQIIDGNYVEAEINRI